jgi:hypothetical protein
MVKNVIIAISATYVMLLGFPLLVAAQESQDTETLQEVVTQVNEEASEEQIGRTIEERVKKAKDKSSEQSTVAQQRRIEARCTSAQEKINNLRTKISDSIEKRREIYLSASTRLAELLQKLELTDIDTSSLGLAVSDMDDLLTSTRFSVDSYMQNLADLSEMDCESDPDGFKALLQDARTKRSEILSGQSEIKTFKDEILKPALQEIRQALNASINSQEGGE